jgi:hypothetical protein
LQALLLITVIVLGGALVYLIAIPLVASPTWVQQANLPIISEPTYPLPPRTSTTDSQIPQHSLTGYIGAGSGSQVGVYTFTSDMSCDTFTCTSSEIPTVYVLYVQPSVNIDLSQYVNAHVELTGTIGHDAYGNLMIMISQAPIVLPVHG